MFSFPWHCWAPCNRCQDPQGVLFTACPIFTADCHGDGGERRKHYVLPIPLRFTSLMASFMCLVLAITLRTKRGIKKIRRHVQSVCSWDIYIPSPHCRFRSYLQWFTESCRTDRTNKHNKHQAKPEENGLWINKHECLTGLEPIDQICFSLPHKHDMVAVRHRPFETIL